MRELEAKMTQFNGILFKLSCRTSCESPRSTSRHQGEQLKALLRKIFERPPPPSVRRLRAHVRAVPLALGRVSGGAGGGVISPSSPLLVDSCASGSSERAGAPKIKQKTEAKATDIEEVVVQVVHRFYGGECYGRECDSRAKRA